jgi:hypothetical protein
MVSEKQQALKLRATRIIKLHPKLVVINTKHPYALASAVTTNLPITHTVYMALLKLIAEPDFPKCYPIVFLINEKGVAFNVEVSKHDRH